ncbi:NADPH:quinone reductase-like Zn-dependent oxidoreductase [Glaciihabitans tibetensis]|uniref:NADPH:quinone reductase-like Zn-dependent oxidoreductase n=1 Tax=Glaciihabitans tibetensis TaxID=1266600 RepID=A0A2T0VIB5_9MICO|nr:NAD(P)-dependent alcohol dehydrogenase [Glaciihabitans tibetensis]PRY69923.1 NADPH:quinone reductase-like Zn-dependent oxidoreductase [Glaciihabitans tibetensis]
MRAITRTAYGAPETIRLAERAMPVPSEKEVLVRVRSAGVDAGTWHLVTGQPYLMRLFGFGLRAPRDPGLGLAFSGQVVEIGTAVTRVSVGDDVMGSAAGAFAEYLVAPEASVRPIPQGLDHTQAAALPISAVTALEAVRAAHVARGDRVLVLGAGGGVGHFAVQIAVAAGATVTGVCSAAKMEFVHSLGATDVIDYRTTDATALDRQWDVIIDTAGNRPLRMLRRILTRRGTLILVGGEHGGALLGGMERGLAAMVTGIFTRQKLRMLVSRENPADYEAVTALVDDGSIVPRIDRTFPLSEAAAAIESMRSGSVRGKVVLEV